MMSSCVLTTKTKTRLKSLSFCDPEKEREASFFRASLPKESFLHFFLVQQDFKGKSLEEE